LSDNAPDGVVQFGIGDVPAVPGQQVLAAVHGGDCDVGSIAGRGIGPFVIKSSANSSLGSEGQYGKINEEFQAAIGELGRQPKVVWQCRFRKKRRLAHGL